MESAEQETHRLAQAESDTRVISEYMTACNLSDDTRNLLTTGKG